MEPRFGRLLLVDNNYDATVRTAVSSLVEYGIPVQYWDGEREFPDSINNVRVVILDLDLADLGQRGPGFYNKAAKVINMIPGPIVVILLALDFNDDDPIKLNSFYEDIYGGPVHGIISKDGLNKDELGDGDRLVELVISSLLKNDLLNLLISWEVAVGKAIDLALDELFRHNFEGMIKALIKLLCKNFDRTAAAREMANLMIRLASRRISKVDTFSVLISQIDKLNKTNLEKEPMDLDEDLQLINRLMFYKPELSEAPSTGDIYRTSGKPRFDDYAIVLTPRCDILQKKNTRVLVCYGFPLKKEHFGDEEYPPYRTDATFMKKLETRKLAGNPATKSDNVNYLIKRYLEEKCRLPQNLQVIWNFICDRKTFGLCFDFNNIQGINLDVLEEWERICRLDSPFIEDMTQRHGSAVTRIGTMDINFSPTKLKKKLVEEKRR